jgi:hypothetical protein
MSERMVRLRAPDHVAAVLYAGVRYPVENGHVLVPVMAEPALTRPDYGFRFPSEPILVQKTASGATLTLPKKASDGRR